MKKGSLIISLFAATLLLGGCSDHNSDTTSTHSNSEKTVKTSHHKSHSSIALISSIDEDSSSILNETVSSNSNSISSTLDIDSTSTPNSHVEAAASVKSSQHYQQQTLWNQSKTQSLSSFMTSWGKSKGQTYESYGPGKNTNFYGCAFPSQLGTTLLKVNDQPVSMAWSNTGSGNSDYNIVAMYSDSQTAGMSASLYFFTFHNGQPVVLVTRQTNGNITKTDHNQPEDGLHFEVVNDPTLVNKFKNIINTN